MPPLLHFLQLLQPLCNFFFCSSNFFGSSRPPPPRPCPFPTLPPRRLLSWKEGLALPWAPSPPAFKVSSRARSSLFPASKLLDFLSSSRLDVESTADHPPVIPAIACLCFPRRAGMSWKQRLQRHLVHTFDSEQNVHVPSFLPSIEDSFFTLFTRGSTNTLLSLETIAHHS